MTPSLPRMTFEEVYEHHFDFVWRSLGRLGIEPADVKDAAQEVFVVVLRRLPEFEPRAKITTWLFSICYRVAWDRKRSARRRQATIDAIKIWETPPNEDPAAEAERREELALLDRILDRLPVDQRLVFCLFELEGMSGSEIAEAIDVPLGTVHSRLRIARVAFREEVARFDAKATFRTSQARRAGGNT